MEKNIIEEKRKYKGVYVNPCIQRFIARLCIPKEIGKIYLGKYTDHESVVRAYELAARYYDKPDTSILDLPALPSNISA